MKIITPKLIVLLGIYWLPCLGFWDSLLQTHNKPSSPLASVVEEIFGNSKEESTRRIFVAKRGFGEDEEEEEQAVRGIESLGGGPGGNAAIVCPSGNRVYVHPISGDLQQCSQQLGFYNQTTCPGGTVCERFPILIPGFQDYCCWGNDTSESETLILGTSTRSSVIEGPDSGDFGPGSISGGYTDSPISTSNPDNSEESEWIVTTTASAKTKRTRRPRPRSRKISTTTTEAPTTTTTQPIRTPAPRRGPRCDNPDDAALIDFGNRLRDCYYQQCPYNYRCEFNAEIRRYICCGKERDVFPSPGMPPLPEPRPIVPRPFRPRVPGPYLHEEEEETSNPLIPSTPLLETNDESDNEISTPSTCPLNHEHRTFMGRVSYCEPDNLSFICPTSHPYCLYSSIWGATVCCSANIALSSR